MDKNNPLGIVRHFSTKIDNGRTLRDIHQHAVGELDELNQEIDHLANKALDLLAPGDDGVVGEAVDVIACMLDAIFVAEPDITDAAILEILLAKCEKWERRYGESVIGDRTIT